MLAFLFFAATVAAISGQKPASCGFDVMEAILSNMVAIWSHKPAASGPKLSDLQEQVMTCGLSAAEKELNVAVAYAAGLNICCECIGKARIYAQTSKPDPDWKYKAVRVNASEHEANPSWLAEKIIEDTCARKGGVGCILEESGANVIFPKVHLLAGGLVTVPNRDVVCVVERQY